MIAKIAKPEEKEYWLGLNVSIFGLGLMAGPVISSALYAFLSFRMTFFIYGGSEVIFALILKLCLKETTP